MKIGRSLYIRRFVLGCAALVVAGCSEDVPVPPEQADAPDRMASSHVAAPQPPTVEAVANGAAGTKAPKSISGIPLDVWPEVWFEDPLAVAGDPGDGDPGDGDPGDGDPGDGDPGDGDPGDGVAESSAVESVTAISATKPALTDGDSSRSETANEPEWNAYLSAETIKEETKEIRLTLKRAFQSVPRYNDHYKQLQVDGSVLAVLAAIVTEHPVAMTWKSDGPHVRDLAAALARAATGLGKQHYTAALEQYEDLEQLLNGNRPGHLKPAVPKRPFDAIAGRGALMKRMERGEKRIKENSGDEQHFQSEREQLGHEALMIAILAEVTADGHYDLTDEPEYRAQSEVLIQAAVGAARAAAKGDYADFVEARSRMTKSCTACHLDFRFEDN